MSEPSKRDCAPDALIRALQNPICYPHAAPSIELIETHISWVLLAGEFAYKIKKPVQLPFVDFSTLARRKYFCEEELRLNRRFAPKLYLAVVAITGSETEPRIDGIGDPIEYAIKLRRFNPKNELRHLIAGGVVSVDELRQFGREMAATQSALPVVSRNIAATLVQTTADNCAELAGLIGAESATNECDYLRGTFLALRSFIEQRCRNGYVHECHGDLHSGNVVRFTDRLLAFDCIEFDPKLREIDVVHDIAFLVMDLQARGRSDLAYAFLNAWLEQTGDFDGLKLLSYGCVQRALIRAKVALLEGHAVTDETVQQYLRAATRRANTNSPRLIITCGLSGSGKTWLANRLSSELPSIHIRSDVERKRLAGLSALESSRSAPDAGIYTRDFNRRTYDRLLTCARQVLTAGENVIVDAAFLRREERLAFHTLSRECNATFMILHCIAPESVLGDRITQRSAARNDASEATLDVLANQHTYWEEFAEIEQPFVRDVDTTAPIDSLAQTL